MANKLKIELKSIKAKGKREQDIVIDLVTEVNNIVLRMKALDMEQLLKVDSDFLSAFIELYLVQSKINGLSLIKALMLLNGMLSLLS